MIQLFKCALPQKQIPHYAHIQGGFLYILQSNSSISVFTLYMFIPIENLTYVVVFRMFGVPSLEVRDILASCKCI